MKIAVVGAGAMGSLFGALLAESGNEVWLCDIRQDHIDAVKQNGLTVEYPEHAQRRDGRSQKAEQSVCRDGYPNA